MDWLALVVEIGFLLAVLFLYFHFVGPSIDDLLGGSGASTGSSSPGG